MAITNSSLDMDTPSLGLGLPSAMIYIRNLAEICVAMVDRSTWIL